MPTFTKMLLGVALLAGILLGLLVLYGCATTPDMHITDADKNVIGLHLAGGSRIP